MKKLFLKRKFKTLFSFIFLSLLIVSCKQPPLVPASNTPKKVAVDLTTGFLQSYSSFHQGSTTQTEVTISVDKLNSSNQIESNYKTYIYQKPNVDDSGVNKNYYFKDIEVPNAGTFLVTVTVKTLSCMNGATGASCNYSKGKVMFRAVSATYNTSNSPSTFYINPTKALEF